MISGRVGKARFSLSYANYLDRTWTNTYSDTQVVGNAPVASNVTAVSSGGISDARAAMSYTFSNTFTAGVGIHQFIGGTSVIYGRAFPADSVQYGAFAQTSTFNFSGSAVSFGVLATPFSHINIAVDERIGFTMRVHRGDSTVLGEARVPNRFSLGVAYDGIPGSILAARYTSENWSAMNGLSATDVKAYDASEFSAGLETGGPRLNNIPMAVRLGFRTRQLPFAIGTNQVTETAFTGGTSIPLSQGRAAVDISLARAHRTVSNVGYSETGYILSVGVSIKPYF